MRKILGAILGIMMGVMMVGMPVMAAGPDFETSGTECVETALFGQVCDDGNGGAIKAIVRWVVNILTGAVTAVAVIGMIISGIQYMTAGGNEQQMVKAKNRILQIAIGLVVWIFMWALLNWLIPEFNGTEAGL